MSPNFGLSSFKLHSIYPVSLSSSRVTWLVCSTSWMVVVSIWGAITINQTNNNKNNKYNVINFKHWNNVPVMTTIYSYIKETGYIDSRNNASCLLVKPSSFKVKSLSPSLKARRGYGLTCINHSYGISNSDI